jgi:cation-transporting ATPase 13A3/4/5
MVTTAAESGQVLSTVDMLKVHGKGLEGGLTELAVTGKAFNVLCETGDMNQLLYYTRIFARFTPEDKVKNDNTSNHKLSYSGCLEMTILS